MNHLIIPNYNGAENIRKILKDAFTYDFDSITLCDDLSTDGSLEDLISAFPKLSIITGNKRVGPGGNRSRILKELGRNIMDGDFLHFLDVDMKIEKIDLAKSEEFFNSNPDVSIVGGLIFTLKGEPMWYNYGFEMHPVRSIEEQFYLESALNHWDDEEAILSIREKVKDITYNLEMTFGDPRTVRTVDWVSEANFIIRASVFKEVGGFDSKMWYHADQDLCKRVRSLGYKVVYNPFTESTHLEIDTFKNNRSKLERSNAFYFYRKHYNFSKKVFDYLFPEV